MGYAAEHMRSITAFLETEPDFSNHQAEAKLSINPNRQTGHLEQAAQVRIADWFCLCTAIPCIVQTLLALHTGD